MLKLISVSTLVIMSALSGCASLNTVAVTGKVVSSIPMDKTCHKDEPSIVKQVLYTAIGVGIGNQFGGGNGKKVAQVVGGVGGYASSKSGHTGKEICKVEGYITKIKYTDPNSFRYRIHTKETKERERVGTRISIDVILRNKNN